MRDADELVARIEPLLPAIAANAAEGERLRRLPDPTLALLREADVFRTLVSPTRGGHGLGLDAVLALGLTLGRADTATAWVVTFLVMHSWLLSMFPEDVVDDVFADRGYALAPAALAPTGTASRVPGGYEVSGRWSWATGVEHADAVLVTGVVAEGDELELRMLLLDLDQVTVADVWHTDGMRATGSNDVVVTGAFVPAERTLSFAALAEGGATPVEGTPMAGYPVVPVLCLTAAAPLVGGAGGAFEAYRERLAGRVLAYSVGQRQVEKPAAQVRLARADADLRVARLLLDDCVRTLDGAYGAGGSGLARADRSTFRLATTTAVHTAKRAVASLCDAAGGSAHLLDQPLQRFQRDLNTGVGHAVFDEDRVAETHGRLLVGFEAGPTDLL
jgi:alkylation response protein AidB-like acyl-CoA dehydrogenase